MWLPFTCPPWMKQSDTPPSHSATDGSSPPSAERNSRKSVLNPAGGNPFAKPAGPNSERTPPPLFPVELLPRMINIEEVYGDTHNLIQRAKVERWLVEGRINREERDQIRMMLLVTRNHPAQFTIYNRRA